MNDSNPAPMIRPDAITIPAEAAERSASALSLRLNNSRLMLQALEKDNDEEGAEFYRDVISRDNYSMQIILGELHKIQK